MPLAWCGEECYEFCGPMSIAVTDNIFFGGGMRPEKHKPGFRRPGNLLYSVILLSIMVFLNGCTGKGDLTFNPLPDGSEFSISGKISLPEIIETDLAGTLKASLAAISDYSTFMVSAAGVTVRAAKDGSFTLKEVPFSQTMVLRAQSAKIALLRRITEEELYYSDLSKLTINLQSTSEALVYQQGVQFGKNLTPADIRAREYENSIGSITTAIKLMLQLPATAVASTVLDLPAVTTPVITLAGSALEREIVLKEANSILRHALLRKDLELLKVYISPSFGNDWDSTSTWDNVIQHFTALFKEYSFTELTWRVIDSEFLPDSKARIRTEVKIKLKDLISEQIVRDKTLVFDAVWQREGTFWKILRNMPYLDSHPTQVGADARWGELATAHRELQAALAVENLAVFSNRISNVFGNDFDVTSTKNDLIVTAQSRFNAMDVKIAEYVIDAIEFHGVDQASIRCHANVRVINLVPGVDIDSGKIAAQVEWRKEDGIWKIARNLPYRFNHKTTLD